MKHITKLLALLFAVMMVMPSQAGAVTVLTPDMRPLDSIDRLYQAVFLREGDQAGLDYWRRKNSQGLSLEDIADEFARAKEFKNRYGDLNDPEFVDLVYQNVMGRKPDSEGKRYWLAKLIRITRGEMVFYFSDSQEFINKTARPEPKDLGLTNFCILNQLDPQVFYTTQCFSQIEWPELAFIRTTVTNYKNGPGYVQRQWRCKDDGQRNCQFLYEFNSRD